MFCIIATCVCDLSLRPVFATWSANCQLFYCKIQYKYLHVHTHIQQCTHINLYSKNLLFLRTVNHVFIQFNHFFIQFNQFHLILKNFIQFNHFYLISKTFHLIFIFMVIFNFIQLYTLTLNLNITCIWLSMIIN